jgi:hypothetical protein
MREQANLMQQLMKEPDLPTWYNQREGVTQALGDRVFDKSFDQVFNALVVALSSMGAEVSNMERQSGYIAARGKILPPDRSKALRHEGLVEYCRHHGYDPSLLDVRKGSDFEIDPDMGGSMMDKWATAMTISLVKQGEKQTKVKLRFTGVYYPRLLEESYKVVWPTLDKQIFLDKNLD